MKPAKRKGERSPKSGENTTGIPILSQLREDKKLRIKLYKAIWKRWAEDAHFPYWKDDMNFGDNPQAYANYKKVLMALEDMGLTTFHGYEIYLKYYEKATKFWLKKVYEEKIPFPLCNKTQAIWEFLNRGFVHYTDFIPKPDRYYIQTHLGDFRWPEDFEHQHEAADIMSRYGIPGYTGIKGGTLNTK